MSEIKKRILVVEDDRSLREGLRLNLELHGYEVVTAADGEAGMRLAFDSRPDLIILDVMLPVWSGLDILEELRKRDQTVPVLILSARGETNDKVSGLLRGADDYMAKPFDLPELLARVAARLRSKSPTVAETVPPLRVGPLTISKQARTVQVSGKRVQLSAKEFDLLLLLAESPDHVFTRDAILERVWGWDYEGTARTVDNFVAHLRKKLKPAKGTCPRIQTVPRVGYKLVP